jgi:hypothetical protein
MWVVTECEVRIGRGKYVPRRGSSSNGQNEVLSASDKMIDPHDYAGMPKENETFKEGILMAMRKMLMTLTQKMKMMVTMVRN